MTLHHQLMSSDYSDAITAQVAQDLTEARETVQGYRVSSTSQFVAVISLGHLDLREACFAVWFLLRSMQPSSESGVPDFDKVAAYYTQCKY